MTTTVQELLSAGDRLFGKRDCLLDFWQDIAESFMPWVADYTNKPTLGEDYASDLMTSYPLLVARDLCDSFGPMLRPSDQTWAVMEVEGLQDYNGKAWLEWATGTQRRAMYDRQAQFMPAVKAGDRDFGLMGQCVLTVDMMPDRSSLLYRQWHLRDTVWSDGLNGGVECVHQKWKPTAYELARYFGEKALHENVRKHLEPGKDPYCEVNCRRIVIPTDMYHGETKFRTPLVSIYIDVDNQHIIQAAGQRINPFVIPRWQRIPGSQYAVSPAAVCALPEARLLQAMTFTLLEAGEKATNPPMLAAQEAIRGEIDMQAGGVTYYEASYDERQGEVLRPLLQDKSGIPLGIEMQDRSAALLREAFYISKLDLPVTGEEMTAYEVSQRVKQYIRNTLPLFEPMEIDYNGALCERTFDVLADNGAFGPPETWPDSLIGEDIRFRFVSPLRDAIEKQKGQTFLESQQIISAAAALDPNSTTIVNASEALRDALSGIGVPVRWTRSREEVQAINEQAAAQEQQQAMLNQIQQASEVAKNLQGAQL